MGCRLLSGTPPPHLYNAQRWQRTARPDAGQLSIRLAGIYDLDSRRYDWITDFGDFPVWLNAGRRILFVSQGKIFLLDTKSRNVEPVLTVTDEDVDLGTPALSRDNRTI